jgi:autotransporter-associated beta strand protein
MGGIAGAGSNSGGGGGGGGSVILTGFWGIGAEGGFADGTGGSGGSGADGAAPGISFTTSTPITFSGPFLGFNGISGGPGVAPGANGGGGGGGGGGEAGVAIIFNGTAGGFLAAGASATGGLGGAGGNGGGTSTATGGAGGNGGGGGDGGIGIAFTDSSSLDIGGSVTGGRGGFGGEGGRAFDLGGFGGAGGAGGAGMLLTKGGTVSVFIGANVTGGAGGRGGDGGDSSVLAGGGATGGAGGAGILLINGGTVGNLGIIAGGGGGGGGDGANGLVGGDGGSGGAGGAGISLPNGGTVINGVGASIIGGGGGAASAGGLGTDADGDGGAGGLGGVGIIGSNLAITNSGAISGGLAFGGVTRANAIQFTGGTNTLTLQTGSVITGNVVAFSSADTLALGGILNSTFDVSQIGPAQYLGFGHFQKTGTSTWTLTNSSVILTPWTINAGTLNVSSDAALGDISGGLTMNGGTLQFGAIVLTSRAVTLNGGGGTFDTNAHNIALAGTISGSGALTKIGFGSLALSGNNSYSGGTLLDFGTLALGNSMALGTGPLTFVGDGPLQFAASSLNVGNAISLNAFVNATIDTNGNNGTLAGNISGPGQMEKIGAGTLTLTGSNTYTGSTVVTAGTLQGNTSSLQGFITDNAAVVFNQSANGVYAGNISGSGTLSKIGAGTLILDGTNTYTGGTTVTAGTLAIGDAAHPNASVFGNVTVSNATLMGHGSITGRLINADGIVMPGGSIGTLTIGGNYTQGAAGTLAIEVSPAAASKLVVGGTAALAGTLALTFDPGVYAGKSFTLVSAATVTGTFATVTSNAPLLTQSVTYTPTEVDLTTGTGFFQVTPTQDSVFGSLGGSALMGGQQSNATLLGHLADQHNGTGTDTIKTSLAGKAPTRLAFNGSTQALASVVSALPDVMTKMGGWFRALGTFADLDSSASAPGFNSRAGGFMAGFDGPVADNLRMGIAGGYGHTDLSAKDGENGSLDTPRIAVYGSTNLAGVSIDALAGYGYDMIHAQRPIAATGAVASSHHNGQEANAALQASKPFAFGDITVQPAAGITYTHLFENTFTETGAGGFNLTNPTRDTDSLRPFVSASASQAFMTGGGMRIVPEADISYSYETMSNPPSLVQVGGGSFTVAGATPSRNQLQIGGGVTMTMTNQLALHAAYHVVLPTGNLVEHIVEAGASYRF